MFLGLQKINIIDNYQFFVTFLHYENKNNNNFAYVIFKINKENVQKNFSYKF